MAHHVTVSANIMIIQRNSSNGQFPDAQMAPHVKWLHNITYFQQRPWKLDLVHQLTIWMLHITQHMRHILKPDSGSSIGQQCCLLFAGAENKREENVWKRGRKPILLGLTVGVLGSFEFWENLRSSWWISVPSPWSKKPWDELVTSDRELLTNIPTSDQTNTQKIKRNTQKLKRNTQLVDLSFVTLVQEALRRGCDIRSRKSENAIYQLFPALILIYLSLSISISIYINTIQHACRMGLRKKDNATIICQKTIYIATDLVVVWYVDIIKCFLPIKQHCFFVNYCFLCISWWAIRTTEWKSSMIISCSSKATFPPFSRLLTSLTKTQYQTIPCNAVQLNTLQNR